MMNLHGLLQELGILAESARKVKSTEGVFELSSQFQKVLDTFVKSSVVNIADRLLGLQHALQLYGDLLPQLPSGGDVEKWGHGLFMTSARLVLGPDFSTLKQNDIPVNSFKSTLTVLYSRLQNNAVGHYFLVLQWLLVHLWNHPTLVAMMKGEDIERQRALTYLRSGEYPELIRLRVDMLADGGLEMYALNLCSWCVQSPIFADDTSVRLNQLLLLHKLGKQEEFHNQCWQVPCCQGVQILEELNKRPDKDSKQAVNLMLAQTFLLQDWMKPAKFCCTQKLLDLWLQIQRKVEPDTGQFLQSISKVAQLAQSSRQLNKMAVTLNAQYGKEFLQLCTELCLAALRIDKKKLDSVQGQKQSVDMDQAVEGLVHTSLLLAKIYEGHPEIQMGAYLSALYLEPSVETYLKSVALKESTPVKSEIICPFNVHPNTLMETLQLLNSLRPSTLNPNADSQVFKDQCLKVMSHAGLTVPVAPHGFMENPLADIPNTSSQDKKFKPDISSPNIRMPAVPPDVTQKGKGEVPNIATSSATYTSDSVVLQAADTLQALAHQIVSKAAIQPPVPVITSTPPNSVQGAPATNADPLAQQAYPWNASQSANTNPVPFSFPSNTSGDNLRSIDAVQSISEPGKDTNTSMLSPVGKKNASQNMSNAGKNPHMMPFSIADASKPGVPELQSASASLAKLSGMIPGGLQGHQPNMPTMLGENSERNTDIIAQAFLQSGLMPSSQTSGSDSPSQTNDSPKKTRTKAAIVRALREKATTPNKELMAANVEGENSPVPMVPIPSSQFPPWHGPSNSGPRTSAAGEGPATTSTASEIESMTPEAVAQILSMIANSHHSHYGQQQGIQVSKASDSPDAGARSAQILPPVSAPGRRLSAPPWGTPASQCPPKMGASPDGPISSFPNIVNALLTENVLKMTEEDGTEKKKRRRKKKKSVSESCDKADELDAPQSHFEKPVLDGQNIQQDSSTGNPKPPQPSASDLPPIHSVLFSSLPSTNVLASNPAGGLPPMSGFLSSPDGNNDLVPNWSQFSVLPPKDHSVLCHGSGEGTEQKPPIEVEAFRCSYCSKSFDSMVQKMRHEEWMCSVKDAKGPQQQSDIPDGVPKKKKRRKKKKDPTASSEFVVDTSTGKSLIAVPSQEAVDNLIAEPLKKAKKTKLYKCYFCTAVFESRHHLNKHREKCRTETKLDNPYVCQFCDLEFPSMPSLNGHLLSKHRGGLAEADPTLLTQKISVKDVMMLKVVKFMCCCCVNLFDNYKQWQDHKVECLPEAECDRYNEFQCIYCDAAFESRNRCYTHCKSKCELYQEHGSHGNQKTWRCKLCKQVFNSYGSLNGHLLSRHTKYGKEYIEDIKKEDSKGNETETAAINIENSMFVDKSGQFGSADAGAMLDETVTATETIGSAGGIETSTGEFVESFANPDLYAGQEVVVSAHEQVATTQVDPIDGTDLNEVPTVDSVIIEDNNIECTTVLEGSIISLNEDDPVPTAACGVEITTSASEEEPSDFSVSRKMQEDACTSGHGCESAEGCDASGASNNAVIKTEEKKKKKIPAMAVEESARSNVEAVAVEKVEHPDVSGRAVPAVTAVETMTREVQERFGENLPVKVEAMELDTAMHKCSHCQLVFLTESLKTNHELYSCFVAPGKRKALESNAKSQQVTLSAAVPCTISEIVSCKAASANSEPSVAGSASSGRPVKQGSASYHEGQSGSSEASAQSVIEQQPVTVRKENPVVSSELVVPNISSQEHGVMDNTHVEQPGSDPEVSVPSHVKMAGESCHAVEAVQVEMKSDWCAANTRDDGNQPESLIEVQNNNSEEVCGRPLQSDLMPRSETRGILEQERGQSGAVFPNNLDKSGKELRKKHIRTAKDAALVKIITAEDSVDDICKADLAAHKKVPFTKTNKGAPAKPICKPRDYDESGRDGDGPGGGGLVCQYCNYNRAFEKQFSLLCHQKWVHGITDPSVQSKRSLKNAAGKCQHSCTCCQHTPMKAVDMNGKYCSHPQHIGSCDHPEASCKHLSVKLQRLNVNQYIHNQTKNQPVQDSTGEEQHGEPDISYHSSLPSVPDETAEMHMHTVSRGGDENRSGVPNCTVELTNPPQEEEFVGELLPSKRTVQNVAAEAPAGSLTSGNTRIKRVHSDPESTNYALDQALHDEDKKKDKKMRTDLNKNETYDSVKTSLPEISLTNQGHEDSGKTKTAQRKTRTVAEPCDKESTEPSSESASSPLGVSRCIENTLAKDNWNENVLKLDRDSGSESSASVPVCPEEDSKFTKIVPSEEQAVPRRTLWKRTRQPRVERANRQRARLMQKAKRPESGQDSRLQTTPAPVARASPVKKVVTRASRSSMVIKPASPEKVRALNKITNGIIARHRKMKKGQLVRNVKGGCKKKV